MEDIRLKYRDTCTFSIILKLTQLLMSVSYYQRQNQNFRTTYLQDIEHLLFFFPYQAGIKAYLLNDVINFEQKWAIIRK